MKPFVHYLTKLTTIMYKKVSRVRVTEFVLLEVGQITRSFQGIFQGLNPARDHYRANTLSEARGMTQV